MSKLCEETYDDQKQWAMAEIDKIRREGFGSVTTKEVDSREVWWEKE